LGKQEEKFMADINPKVPLSIFELNKIQDRAKALWHTTSNNEYDASEWVTLCYVVATLEHFKLPIPPEIKRDFYAALLED